MMQKDNIEFIFQRSDAFKTDVIFSQNLPIGAAVSFDINIEEKKAFYPRLKSKKLAD